MTINKVFFCKAFMFVLCYNRLSVKIYIVIKNESRKKIFLLETDKYEKANGDEAYYERFTSSNLSRKG